MQIANKTSPKYICFERHMTMSWCLIRRLRRVPTVTPSHRNKKRRQRWIFGSYNGESVAVNVNGPKKQARKQKVS